MDYDLSFDATARTLESAGISVNPAEAHGILTGLVCAGNADAEVALSALGDPGDFPELRDYVTATHDQLSRGLGEAGLEFEPLLPDEDLPAAQRSRALTQWCSGFNTGFHFRGTDDTAGYSETATEALADIAELADASGTVSEPDLIEIIEYLRVAIQLIYEETADKAA
ncbi:MAG TPA: UPF0149 family protein [Acidiferrobacter sp.]|nr:UPF0149 family protein [Acidiferrobacter sp.]